MRFEGKTGLVTGAGSGIGRAVARQLGAEGAFVAVVDVAVESGHETVEQIQAEGGSAIFLAADVSEPGAMDRVVAELVASRGRLDFAHNNAGINGLGIAFDETPDDAWDRIVGINAKGVWLSLRAEIPVMKRQGIGAIVNTASISGLVTIPMLSPYSASKHAVIGLTKEAAGEFGGDGIRVNAVCPGYIVTGMSEELDQELFDRWMHAIPAGRTGEPREISEGVTWLLSDAASYVTGHSLVIDGGLTSNLTI
jgi:NAD(P)-dependent dehydrogenase (short-subunit alcohol dehydrogenase family)